MHQTNDEIGCMPSWTAMTGCTLRKCGNDHRKVLAKAQRDSQNLNGDALAAKIVLEIVDKLQLLLDCEPTDNRLKHRADSNVIFTDEAAVVDIDEYTHQELAIHSISHTPMSGDAVPKVFDVEGALETRGEKASEGRDQ